MANELNYTNFNFEDLVTQLQNRVQEKDAWKDIYRSGTGQMLLEVMAYVLNMGLYYTERRAQESYLPTARHRSSVVNLVALLGYQPKRKVSAVGNLQFTLGSAKTKIVFVPKYTECQSSTGVTYLTNASAAIEKGNTEVVVEAIQGEIVTIENNSDGTLNQSYRINDTNVENSGDTNNPSLRITINGNVWTPVTSFIRSNSTSRHYRILNNMDGTITIIFGDNVNGLAPESGSTIRIRYIRSNGSDGNLANLGQITTINDTLYDEDGAVVSDASVTNTSSFLGGDDEESVDEIKYEAPRVFKTGDRAVTREDFMAILENYPGVAAANVWGENEEAELAGVPAVQEMLNLVRIAVVLTDWELPDETFQSVLGDFLYDNSMLTVKYEFVDPDILQVIPVLNIVVNRGYSLTGTQADVSTAISDEFVLGDTTKIGTLVKYSQILSAIHELDGVSYATMVLEIIKELSEDYDSVHDWGGILEATEIEPESIRLFVDNTEVGTDSDNGDGTGSFTDGGGYTIAGDVDYATGELTLDITPAPSAVHVRYQQAGDGNIRPTFRQICRLYGVDVESIQTNS